MEQFLKWFATSPIASFIRTFAATVLTLAIAEFSQIGAFDFTNWRVWVIAALVSAAPPLLRWLNPEDALG